MAAFLLAATAITEMDKVVPKVAGVEAPELMAKLPRRLCYRVKGIPANEAIIAVAADNFHGRSLFAVSASTDPMAKDDFGPFLPGIEVVPFNDIDALRTLFEQKGERIASYIVEPIQGEAGVIIPAADYHRQVAELCKKHNVLFCMDEVQTGFARTGANFAHQLYGVKPDLMACGKAAGGGIMPVSFVAGRRDVINVLTPGSEGSTFGGFPLASVTATFAIKAMVDMNLAENAQRMGQRMLKHFNDIKAEFPDKIKEGRGAGLLTAFEMFDEPGLDGHKVSVKLLENGVYAKETHKTTVRLAPALTIKESGIDHIGESIRKVIQAL
jgi:ornithine--oxo-acid transaminase